MQISDNSIKTDESTGRPVHEHGMQAQICTQCVMDSTDSGISFDEHGICSHCLKFETETRHRWFPNEEGQTRLRQMIDQIRARGRGKEYDCILGLSGGIDSSYMALKIKDWGLRPLVVHVDAGWNSELAVGNIEKIVKHCNYDLHTHVVDWEDMRDLQLSYLRSGISNQDVPQDHIFFSSLYHFAIANDIQYILSGGNIATEGIMADNWHEGSAMDSINLKAIHQRFGEKKLRSYKTISFGEYYVYYPLIKKMRTFRPLNFIPYNKKMAVNELRAAISWQDYGRKHGESLFTKVFQNDYLVRKYGYDKRKPHLSSLIVSGQMTRDEALKELARPLYDPEEREIDLDYFCKKLRISRADYEAFVTGPKSTYYDYPNWEGRYRLLKKVQSVVERARAKRINVYS
jgi:N-acetyl sugar amidotransferase